MSPAYAPPTDLATLHLPTLAADLRELLATIEPRLRAIPPDVAARPLAPGKWSLQQTFGHLIDSAANNQQRLLRLQLTPNLHFPGYPQDQFVGLQRFDLLPWHTVLNLWSALNHHFAHTIEHTDPSTLTHLWHPEPTPDPVPNAGPNPTPISLGFMLVDYLAHLRYHLDRLPIRP